MRLESKEASSMDGILVIEKASGMTSHDVVAKVRRLLKMKRVGHTGTLDPAVTGVLPVCLGKGTRMVEYLQELPKEYEAELTIGTSTDTEDQTGNVVEQKEVSSLAAEHILQVLASFVGEIEQIPPMYSAVKVDGRRLYQLAREGKEVERKPRAVTIYGIEIISADVDGPQPTVRFRVRCSKGTYIRTLCVDIGKALGYPAHMSHLVRTATGPFRREDAITLEELEQAIRDERIESLILPIERAVEHLPKVILLSSDPKDVLNGKTLSRTRFKIGDPALIKDTSIAVFQDNGTFLAIYQMKSDSPWLKPVKVFS
jgi:tRNA pseudouridine55 synthase